MTQQTPVNSYTEIWSQRRSSAAWKRQQTSASMLATWTVRESSRLHRRQLDIQDPTKRLRTAGKTLSLVAANSSNLQTGSETSTSKTRWWSNSIQQRGRLDTLIIQERRKGKEEREESWWLVWRRWGTAQWMVLVFPAAQAYSSTVMLKIKE